MILALNIMAAWGVVCMVGWYIKWKIDSLARLESLMVAQLDECGRLLGQLEEVHEALQAKLVAVEAAIKVVVPFVEKLDKVY